MSGRAGAARFWIVLVAVVVVVAVVVAPDGTTGPLDPRSVSPDGARGVVELVEAFGADVEIGVDVPGERHAAAVLLRDTYGIAAREQVEAWVRAGGVLLVADPTSPLTPPTTGGPPAGIAGPAPACDGALAAVQELTGVDAGYAPPSVSDAATCLDAAVSVDPLGEGAIVAIGGPRPLLNERLDEADNAVLAVAVLAPTDGTAVAFLEPRLPVGDQESLVVIVSDPVWVLLAQLVVGFLLVAWWQARRLGRPVSETTPVEIAGSELTVARGRMLGSIRSPDAAAELLRAETRRELAAALGIPAGLDDDVLARRVAAATGHPADDVAALLGSAPVADDTELVALGRRLAGLRRAAAGPGGPLPAATAAGASSPDPTIADATPADGGSP